MKTTLFSLSLLFYAVTVNAQHTITIDATQAGRPISQMLYGIFYEDINHAADGGIYAELVRNRSFEENPGEPVYWSTYSPNGGEVAINLVNKGLLNNAQSQALHIVSKSADGVYAGVCNSGYWGIDAVKGREYKYSLWIKNKKNLNLKVQLVGKNGVYGEADCSVAAKKNAWQKVSGTIVSQYNDKEAKLVVATSGNTEYMLDMVSLFPPTFNNRENGLRPDLVEMLQNLHPRFLRFPGGCFVEGKESPDYAFRWERTIGHVEERPGHLNRQWGYHSTDGLGFHEYLLLCEDLNTEPLYVVNIGIWHGSQTPVDSLDGWIQECLDAIEYANGPVTSKYGALRAANGHPEPFNIRYLEIGNENNNIDNSQSSDHYYDRYHLFMKAVKEKYPEMILIGNVDVGNTDEPRWLSADPVDIVDEHYYKSPRWFISKFHKYDSYDRNLPKVYCGEYAVTQGWGSTGNLNAALGEAVFMMGMENNADHVIMSSYAPIFGNERDMQWAPDMVRFDTHDSYGTPSYYVQRLMAENLGTRALQVENSEIINEESSMLTPLRHQAGFATWDTQSSFKDMKLTVDGKTVDFACEKEGDYTPDSDGWKLDADGLHQCNMGQGCTAVLKPFAEGRTYSLTMKARKDGGNEGFVLVFNYLDRQNYCWLNIGGWTNTRHGLEQCINGDKFTVESVPGSIETGRWYDVRVDVDGNHIEAFLDDVKVMEHELESLTIDGLFTSASIDDNTGEMILKIVNTSKETESVDLNLKGFDVNSAQLTFMKSASGRNENRMDNQTLVSPQVKTVNLSDRPQLSIPPYSLNIYRLKK